MAILGLQIDRSYQGQIEEGLHGIPEVRFVDLTLGSYDVMLEVWLPSTDMLLDFLTNQLSQLSGIQRVEAWQVLKLSKYSYDWGEWKSVSSLSMAIQTRSCDSPLHNALETGGR